MGLFPSKGMYEQNRVIYLPTGALHPNPDQPRSHFDPARLEQLAQSIRGVGLLQPLTVRRVDGQWELVSGERRLRAAKLAGLEKVPCLEVRADGQTSSLLALVENLQRRDLDFWEQALALRRLLDTYHLSQEEAARRIGKSQSVVANKLRLLRLDPRAAELLRDHGCSERHARALLVLEDPALQLKCARQVVEQELTVARTEALAAALSAAKPAKRRPRLMVRDVRLFLNTISHALDVMRSSGVDARCTREDGEGEICLIIHIPKAQ